MLSSCLFNLFSNGAWCALYAITPEVYPTTLRAQGFGVAHSLHSVAAIAAQALGGVGLAYSAAATNALLLGMIGLVAVAGGCAALLPLEMSGAALDGAGGGDRAGERA